MYSCHQHRAPHLRRWPGARYPVASAPACSAARVPTGYMSWCTTCPLESPSFPPSAIRCPFSFPLPIPLPHQLSAAFYVLSLGICLIPEHCKGKEGTADWCFWPLGSLIWTLYAFRFAFHGSGECPWLDFFSLRRTRTANETYLPSPNTPYLLSLPHLLDVSFFCFLSTATRASRHAD